MNCCREYGLESRFGEVNPQLSVSVSSPPDVATIGLIAEGGVPSCPWSVLQVHVGKHHYT